MCTVTWPIKLLIIDRSFMAVYSKCICGHIIYKCSRETFAKYLLPSLSVLSLIATAKHFMRISADCMNYITSYHTPFSFIRFLGVVEIQTLLDNWVQ